MTSSDSPDLAPRLRGLMLLSSVPLLRKALRAASGETSPSSSNWTCDLDALCRSEAYDSPSSSRSSPGAKISSSKSCWSTSSQDSVSPGRERLDRAMLGVGVLERKKASGWLQVVPFDCAGMCLGVCSVRQLQRPAAVFTVYAYVFAKEMRRRKVRLVWK